ncbi:UNKNOWN [Stylonychia lemnae]|uniref:Lebercilin domain-containing protein n=1 Tax=Stylonychia lemnae TaxID=5949 RepID=A0A078ASF9_STYLE|nr:UNKNOWN [Stylonychia lemnae]|eukprot:CDW84921.1 UNKNOWN [Stylonychia lemnae]
MRANFNLNSQGSTRKTPGIAAEKSSLYRQIASREVQKRSPRIQSQAVIPLTQLNIATGSTNNTDNTFSEVQSLLRGLFASTNNDQRDVHLNNSILDISDYRIDDKDATIQRLQDTNEELNNQLKLLSNRLDDLMFKVKQKQLQDDKDLQKLAQCGHDAILQRLQKQVKDRDDDIKKIKDRMDGQIRLKEREITNTQDKIQQSKKELVAIQKKSSMTDSERIVDLEQKIIGTELKIKDLQKEIKNLKKIQHDQGNELLGLDNKEEYPEKIRSLMEEVRWAKDKQIELQDKIAAEEKQVKRQKEHLLNLEDSKNELDQKYRRQVMKLENKLFTMKMKELAQNKDRQLQQQASLPMIMRNSPRRQVKSATRNKKSSISSRTVINHQGPFTLSNNNLDQSIDVLKKKKNINESYSFLLGKLDRSRSKLKPEKSLQMHQPNKKGQGDFSLDYGSVQNMKSNSILLPQMNIYGNNSRNQKQQFKTIDSTPKIRITQPITSIQGNHNPIQPYQTVRQSKNSSIRGGSEMRKSHKRVEFMDDTETSNHHNRLENSFDIKLDTTMQPQPNLNFGTNRSLRRKRGQDELENGNIQLPEFKINLNNNTDDILQQLKNNLNKIV